MYSKKYKNNYIYIYMYIYMYMYMYTYIYIISVRQKWARVLEKWAPKFVNYSSCCRVIRLCSSVFFGRVPLYVVACLVKLKRAETNCARHSSVHVYVAIKPIVFWNVAMCKKRRRRATVSDSHKQ